MRQTVFETLFFIWKWVILKYTEGNVNIDCNERPYPPNVHGQISLQMYMEEDTPNKGLKLLAPKQ